jgi:spore germination protein GerM
MARTRSSNGSSGTFVSIAVVVVIALGAGYWFTTRKPAVTPEKVTVSPTSHADVSVKERRKVKIYVMKIANDDVTLVPETRSVPADVDPHRSALERLVATNHESGSSQHLVPVGTKLLGLEIKDGIAYADFSKELAANFNGGSESEALLVNSIAHTLTQFSDVKKVQILIDGRKTDSIGGHLDISEPIAPDSAMLGQGAGE